MRNKWIKILAITGAAVWWLVFYPELSFIDGTYQLVLTDDDGQMILQDDSLAAWQVDTRQTIRRDDILSGLLGAGKDEIVFESRLLEWLSEKR